jgi:hypothetical protein
MCGVQLSELETISIGVMQQAASAARIIFKYLYATEQHFACCQKWKRAARSMANASGGV